MTTVTTALVIDIGTDSVRGTIGEIGPSTFRELEDIQRPLDLTAGFRGGHLSSSTIRGLHGVIEDLVEAGKAYGVSTVRAVATSALREAGNADLLIDGIRRRIGVVIEIIDAAEEARLYYEALRWVQRQSGIKLIGRTLLMDIGSGTTVFSLISGGKLVHAVDDHFGTKRLEDEFVGLRDSHDFAEAIDRFSRGAAEMQLGRLPRGVLRNLVVTGSEVRLLLHILRPDAGGLVESLPARLADGWYEAVAPQTPRLRAELTGCDRDTATRLLPVVGLLRHLCRLTGCDRVLVPRLTLRDGLQANLLPGSLGPHHLGRNQLLAAARSNCQSLWHGPRLQREHSIACGPVV